MDEKIYKSMGTTGACNLVLGILILVGGITSGVLLIVHGGKLLKHRRNITF